MTKPPRTPSAIGKGNRRRGQTAERELCALLSDALGIVVKRKLGQARESGNDIDLPPYRIEAKRRASFRTLYQWMAQCIKDSKPSEAPVVMVRADGERWLVVMELPDWIKLAREEISK